MAAFGNGPPQKLSIPLRALRYNQYLPVTWLSECVAYLWTNTLAAVFAGTNPSASIYNILYRKMISALSKSFPNSMHPLDAALATTEVKTALAAKNYTSAVQHLIKSLSRLETSIRLTTTEYITMVKEQCMQGERNPNGILQIMKDLHHRVKDGHQLAPVAMRDLYISLQT